MAFDKIELRTEITDKDALDFRKLFIEAVHSKINTESVALAMSGGIDSTSVMFALLELGIPFECYTFHESDHISEDLLSSIDMCETFGVKLNILKLDSSVDTVYNDIKGLKPFIGKKILKTKVETMRPIKYVFEACRHKILFNGFGGDDYQPYKRKVSVLLSKKGEQAVIEAGFRVSKDNNEDSMIMNTKKMARHYGLEFVDAYATKPIEDFFKQFTLKALLSPHKTLVVRAFKDYFTIVEARKHSSYQVNSKTRDVHEKLLKSKYNTRNSKSVIGIYNDILKKDPNPKLF